MKRIFTFIEKAGAGVLKIFDGNKLLYEESSDLNNTINQETYYLLLLSAVKFCGESYIDGEFNINESIIIYLNSLKVVNKVNGVFNCNNTNKHIVDYDEQIRVFLNVNKNVSVVYLPKIKNKNPQRVMENEGFIEPEPKPVKQPIKGFDGIEINEDFTKVIELVNTKKNVLITGNAGTGKTTLLKYLYQANKNKRNVALLAFTGVAAINIEGETIHRFCGFKIDVTLDKVKGKNSKLYKHLDMIIVDEISMVRADLLDCMDKLLKLSRQNNEPFGGIQMVFVGDLYQLQPIINGSEGMMFFKGSEFYQSPYFFASNVYPTMVISEVNLNKIYRQSDEKFIEILNSVRDNNISDENLNKINSRIKDYSEIKGADDYVFLASRRKTVDSINEGWLSSLGRGLHAYIGEMKNFLYSRLPAERNLNIKEGAQVMLVNNDFQKRWVNGTVGKVIEIEEFDNEQDDVIRVKLLDNEVVEVEKYTWEIIKLVWNSELKKLESKTIGWYKQYPIILAWAVTIHKSQGKTLEKVIINPDGIFTFGQAYVALSRAVSFKNMFLTSELTRSHIHDVPEEIDEFLKNK